jgi:hypothetical protein
MGELMSYRVTLQSEDKKHTINNIIYNASKEEAIKFFSKCEGYMDAQGNDHDVRLYMVEVVKL